MRRIMMVVGLLAGLAAGACDAYQFEEGAPIDDGSNVVLGPDDPHLPGSCNNPVTCGGETPQGPLGDNPSYCSGCDCAASPASCRSCVVRCRRMELECNGSSGTTEAGCAALYGHSCEEKCAPAGTCVCPQH